MRALLRLDNEALYSTTDQLTANKIAKIVAKVVPDVKTVTDATACIGGATLAFSKVFHKVNAIELDRTRYEYLRHNMTILGASKNVQCIYGDALDQCAKLQQDLVFLDPPWGGPEYKMLDRVTLRLSNKPLSEVCRAIAPFTKYIAIKVPTNFDAEAFFHETRDCLTVVLRETQLRKMHLFVMQVTCAQSIPI